MQEIKLDLDKAFFSEITKISQFHHPEYNTNLVLNDLSNGNIRIQILVGDHVEWSHDQRNEIAALALMTPIISDQEVLPFGFDQSKAFRAEKKEVKNEEGKLTVAYSTISPALEFRFNERWKEYIRECISGSDTKIIFHDPKNELEIKYQEYIDLFKTLLIIGEAAGLQSKDQ